MGTFESAESEIASLTVVTADGDEFGREMVRDALATATTELLAVVAPSERHPMPTTQRLATSFTDRAKLGLATSLPDGDLRAPTMAQLGKRLLSMQTKPAAERPVVSVVVVRIDAVRAVGGLDPAIPGLGWTDLVQRLTDDGYEVAGAPARLPFIDELHSGIEAQDQIRAEGRWLNAHGQTATGITAATYRRAVLASGAAGPGLELKDRRAIIDDARNWWRGPPAKEQQAGVGRRADWRFLLTDGPREHTLILGGVTAPDGWQWLVDDGWTAQVTTSLDQLAEHDTKPDVIYVAGDAPGPDALADALAVAGQDCSVIVEQDRSPLRRRRDLRAIEDAAFDRVRRFLVTPDLKTPKRFVPLGATGGLDWLHARPPMFPTATGTKQAAASRVRTEATLLASKATEVGRLASRLRDLADGIASGLTDGIAGSVIDGIGDGVVDSAAAALGPGLLIAERGAAARLAANAEDQSASVLLTRGRDEGSRVVLIPLDPDLDADAQHGRQTVTKISPRPGYNLNVDAESLRINTLRTRVAAAPDGPVHLLPETEGPFEQGRLHATKQSYAGRWTASDICSQVPESRDTILQQTVSAIDDFALATVRETIEWSPRSFEQHLGSLFDRYERKVGPDPIRDRLCLLLAERSGQLHGQPVSLVDRHFDLGPWNVVVGTDADLTFTDWQFEAPRAIDEVGLAGADQLYFIKYWLNIAMDLQSSEEELTGFVFLGGTGPADDPRTSAGGVLRDSLARLGLSEAFMPLLTASLWLEVALHNIERPRSDGMQPGSAGHYLDTIARYGDRLLAYWPTDIRTAGG